jgi:hypothetical protein
VVPNPNQNHRDFQRLIRITFYFLMLKTTKHTWAWGPVGDKFWVTEVKGWEPLYKTATSFSVARITVNLYPQCLPSILQSIYEWVSYTSMTKLTSEFSMLQYCFNLEISYKNTLCMLYKVLLQKSATWYSNILQELYVILRTFHLRQFI